ncbi:hypothetical protein MTO96_031098 [Rhipicephalus appendiculatus]
MAEDKLSKAREDGMHKAFKLLKSLSTTSMVLLDDEGVLRTYLTSEDILRDFFATRVEGYSPLHTETKHALTADGFEDGDYVTFSKVKGTTEINYCPLMEVKVFCTGVFATSISNDYWAQVVVTPIMHRVQRLKSAQDIILDDSTYCCDTERNTQLLTAIKAGEYQ